jgi:hypothetical protein
VIAEVNVSLQGRAGPSAPVDERVKSGVKSLAQALGEGLARILTDLTLGGAENGFWYPLFLTGALDKHGQRA